MIFFILFSIISLENALLNLQKIRGEKPSFKINIEEIDKNKLETYVNEALDDTYGNDLVNFEKILHFFNVLKEGESYKERAISIYKEQAAAFYNPKDHSLKIMKGLDENNLFLQNALIHELMHALQDEKLKIYKEMEKRKGNYDSLMAFQTFLEGEATIITFLSIGDFLADDEEIFSALKDNANLITETFEEFMPEQGDFLIYEILLPYKAGVSFVLNNIKDGKWSGIEKIYKFLPCSMEEILHYDKIYKPPKDFSKISKKIKFKNSNRIFSSTFGESFIYFIFSKYFSKEDAKIKAEGWDGDKILLFEKMGRNFILWLLHWDSEEDLNEGLEGFKYFAKNENINLIPLIYNKSLILLFFKDNKIELNSELYKILKKMEVQNVYECKSK